MNKTKTQKIATAGILLGILVVTLLLKNISAMISGPIVNTIIIIAAVELGVWWGIGFSVITPLASMLLAPASPMAALVGATNGAVLPIIMIGNIIFMLCGFFGKKKGYMSFVIALVIGALLKWLFMWGCAEFIISPIFKDSLGKLAAVVNKLFSTLQLYSGLLAIVLIYPIEIALDKMKRK